MPKRRLYGEEDFLTNELNSKDVQKWKLDRILVFVI